MIPVMCVVQKGQITPIVEKELRSEIADYTKRAFEAEANITWIEVPEGSGFTAGEPSTTIIASLHANRDLDQKTRISLLNELCDICVAATGLTPNEVVTSVRNPQ